MYPKATLKLRLQAALLIVSLLLSRATSAQSYGEWTWESGDNTTNTGASYGVKGVAAATNKPGNRDSHSGWKDASGNFWVFGGEDHALSVYDDLWKYNPTTSQWTWVSGYNTINTGGTYGTKGVAAAANVPGGRMGQAGWSDASGNFWIFGGAGEDGSGNLGELNDLWEYNPSSGQWTWASGASTVNSPGTYGPFDYIGTGFQPGARKWTNAFSGAYGYVYVFGGYGYDGSGNVGYLNDLWYYDSTAGRWGWIGGNNTVNGAGVYGTKGTAGAANMPGARYGASTATDASGNIWVFGGTGYDGAGNIGYLNDLWKFNVSTDEWAWVSGNSTVNAAAVYGTEGTAAATNMPGARYGHNMVIDGSGNLWIFGGDGFDVANNQGLLDDLWGYNSTTKEWTWVSGSDIRSQPGVFGTEGVAAMTNEPPGREFSAAWMDATENIWVMGGGDIANADHNDLWKFSIIVTLALENILLQGISQGGSNLLTWQTMEETGPANFVIQRSTAGTPFTDIGTVAAIGDGAHAYSFTDTHPPAGGSAFYRLKIEGAAGDTGYSSIIVLTAQTSNHIEAFPNPTRSGVTLQTGKADLLNTPVKLLDVTGRLISEQEITSPQQYIDLSHFPPGAYLLQFVDGTALKLIKE